MWKTGEISFDFVDDLTSDPVVTVVVSTPAGALRFMAEPEMREEATLVLRAVHAQDGHPNAVGSANLRIVARALMERLDIDGLIVEGSVRTSGANPGRRPRPIRFTRGLRSAPPSGPVHPKDD